MEWRFPLAILLHFLDLVLNHNGLISHVLEIGVIGDEQLELNVVIQPIQEHVLLLLIHIDVIGGVSRELNMLPFIYFIKDEFMDNASNQPMTPM
jgi:glycerol-3-phosphate responsive antiterminator